MAHSQRFSAAAASVATSGADAVAALVNGGTLRLYDGTQPATADTAVTTQTLLATVTFGVPAFAAAVDDVAAAYPLTEDANAAASGVATWLRVINSGGDVVWDGSVGARDQPTVDDRYDCEVSSPTIIMHGTVSITSYHLTQTQL